MTFRDLVELPKLPVKMENNLSNSNYNNTTEVVRRRHNRICSMETPESGKILFVSGKRPYWVFSDRSPFPSSSAIWNIC